MSLEPITREEMFYAKMLGTSTTELTPITRREMFLAEIAKNMGGGKIDPEQIAAAVSAWLDEHPEATTTVADGSITMAKLASAVQEKLNAVSSLSDEIDSVKDAV